MKIRFKKCGFRIDTGIYHATTFGIDRYSSKKELHWGTTAIGTHSDMRRLIGLIY